MAKKAKSATDWKNVKNDNNGWETRSGGGFAPLWIPTKSGETVEVIPLSARYKPKKGKYQETAFITCKLTGGSSTSFFQKNIKKAITKGGNIAIGLSYNLMGEESLGVIDKHKARLSKLSEACKKQNMSMRIVFDGKIKGGQGSVKLFTVQTQEGLKY